MAVKCGPFLAFRGISDGKWSCSAIIVADTEPTVVVKDKTIPGEALWTVDSLTVFRFLLDFEVKQQASINPYKVDNQSFEIVAPGAGQSPKIAYASCNGFSTLSLQTSVKDNTNLWRAIAQRHGMDDVKPPEAPAPTADQLGPYHLLVLGGDQVYADALWETVAPLKEWNEKAWKAGNEAKITATMTSALEKFYFNLYIKNWSQPDVARIMARVPSVAMWDDHDLIDGWGSYPEDRQKSQVYQGIWAAASKAFAVFQQHLTLGQDKRPGSISTASPDWWLEDVLQEKRRGAFSYGYVIGDLAILAVDMRSQRTIGTQVIGAKHWDEIFQWIEGLSGVRHLLFMSSIPVVYPDFSLIESALGFFPGYQDLEDDLKDHWNSPLHKQERVRLVHRLLAASEQKKIRATILSGDVHLGAIGVIESSRNAAQGMNSVIDQLISSGIVHPGPGGLVLFAIQHLFDADDPIDTRITGKMTNFPGSQARFLGGRNYLSIEPESNDKPDRRLWCNWVVEGEKFVFTKVINAIPV